MRRMRVFYAIIILMLSITACDSANKGGNSSGSGAGNSRTSYSSDASNSRTSNNSEETIMNPSTDVAVVEKIFPNLEGIESVEFEVTTLGSGNSTVPGPTDYQYQGYIELTDEAAEKYASSYKWEDFDNDVTFETINTRSGDFKYDPMFTKDIIKKSSFAGKTWVDGNTILFSVHTF